MVPLLKFLKVLQRRITEQQQGYIRAMTQVVTASYIKSALASLMTGLGISSMYVYDSRTVPYRRLTKADRVFLILTAQVWIYFRRHMIRSRENKQSKVLVRIYVVYQTHRWQCRTGCLHLVNISNCMHAAVDEKTDVALQVNASRSNVSPCGKYMYKPLEALLLGQSLLGYRAFIQWRSTLYSISLATHWR